MQSIKDQCGASETAAESLIVRPAVIRHAELLHAFLSHKLNMAGVGA